MRIEDGRIFYKGGVPIRWIVGMSMMHDWALHDLWRLANGG